MGWICVTLLVLCMTSVIYSELMKCCKSNYYFEKNNGTFKCSNLVHNISRIVTNNTNFLENNTNGQCIEFYDNFYVFNVSNSKISQLKIIKENVYPKCCPLNFLYNTETHACEKSNNTDYTDINETFIKIGLPECKIIVDTTIENITEDVYKPGPYSSFFNSCIDRNTQGFFVSRKCEETNKTCSQMRCIQKCCPDGQSYFRKNKKWRCTEGYEGINLTEMALRQRTEKPKEPYSIVVTNTYPNVILLNETSYPSFLNIKGIFSYNMTSSKTIRRNSTTYCIEYAKNPIKGYYFFLYVDRSKATENNYLSYLLVTSAFLLVVTILIYYLLDETKKVFGKILINYNIAILLWYAQLAYMYIAISGFDCLRAAFTVIFARTATFVWSNVMCFDIWSTFGSTSVSNDIYRKKEHLKKIIIYCVYGWGAPLALTLLVYLFYSYNDILPPSIQPLIAQNVCFFDHEPGNYSQLLFHDFPTILLQVINIALFIKTAMHCLKVKNEINRINDNQDKKENFQRNKAKLYLILKLILIMGVTFIAEAITSSVSMDDSLATKILDRIFNVITASQGIFIFIIFICNHQIYNNVRKRFDFLRPSCRTHSTDSVATQSSNASG